MHTEMTSKPRRSLRGLAARLGLLCVGLLMALGAAAQDSGAVLLKDTQAWLDQAVAAARPAGAAPLRLVVSVGSLDSRLNLAPCAQVEPYIPAGMRLWGKTRLGLRCTDGRARWNVFLPVQVQAFGPAWVVRGDVPAGKVLEASDGVQAEVDWAQEPQAILADMELWVGQTATRVGLDSRGHGPDRDRPWRPRARRTARKPAQGRAPDRGAA